MHRSFLSKSEFLGVNELGSVTKAPPAPCSAHSICFWNSYRPYCMAFEFLQPRKGYSARPEKHRPNRSFKFVQAGTSVPNLSSMIVFSQEEKDN